MGLTNLLNARRREEGSSLLWELHGLYESNYLDDSNDLNYLHDLILVGGHLSNNLNHLNYSRKFTSSNSRRGCLDPLGTGPARHPSSRSSVLEGFQAKPPSEKTRKQEHIKKQSIHINNKNIIS